MSPSLDRLGVKDNPADPEGLESSINNYVILRQVFQNVWDRDCLKECRLVCRSWNDIARPLLLTRSVIPLPNDLIESADLSCYSNILLGCPTPSVGVRIPTLINAPDVSAILDECKDFIKYLKLDCSIRDGDCPTFESFPDPDLVLPQLRTLVLTKFLDTWKPERIGLQTQFFVDLIKRAPKLQELVISHGDLPRGFFLALLPPLKSHLNFSSNLQVLRLTNRLENSKLENGDIETLRGMKLRLQTLEMTFPDRTLEPFPSMVGWIMEMRLTLKSLELKTFRSNPTNKVAVFVLRFVSEMPVLRSLIIHDGGLFGVSSIPGLLHNLPVLERLTLSAAPNAVLDKAQLPHEKTGHAPTYPQIRDLLIQTNGREGSDLPLSQFISRVFPNLRKVTLPVRSGTELLSLVEKFKGARNLESLHVILCKDENDNSEELRETQVPSTSHPSSVPWKALQSLTIEYCGSFGFATQFSFKEFPYKGLPLLSLVGQMKGLTCLRLKNVGRIPINNLKDLVGELPTLRSLLLCGWSTVYLNGIGRDDPKLTCGQVRDILHAEMLQKQGSQPYSLCVLHEPSSDSSGLWLYSRKAHRRIFH